MKLNDHFKQFVGNISLNPTREDRINSALSSWEDKLKSNDKLKDIFKDFYPQGSYATKTVIRPQNSNEFDIDTVLVLDLDDKIKPKQCIKFIVDILKEYEVFKDKIIPKERCVRIDYSGEFHMDIVPVKVTGKEYVLIPCKSEDEWKKTNPKGFKKWCEAINKESIYKFAPITRIIKFWRDVYVGKDTAPKSILLTTIVGKNIVGCNSIAESLVLTLENIVDNLDDILNDEGVPYVANPSLKGENLARDWNRTSYDIFKKKIEKFSKDTRDALNEKDETKSIEKWQEIFGSSKFQSTLPYESKVAEQVAVGSAFVSKLGTLNETVGKKVPDHRFFGEDYYE